MLVSVGEVTDCVVESVGVDDAEATPVVEPVSCVSDTSDALTTFTLEAVEEVTDCVFESLGEDDEEIWPVTVVICGVVNTTEVVTSLVLENIEGTCWMFESVAVDGADVSTVVPWAFNVVL